MMKPLKCQDLPVLWKQLFCFFALITFSTSVFAQTKVAETCETKLQNAQKQLNVERASKQEAIEAKEAFETALLDLQHDYSVMEAELAELNETLRATEILLKKALLTGTQGGEVETKLIEQYEMQLKAASAEKLQLQDDLKKAQQEINDAERKYLKLATTVTNIESLFPFFVTNIEFRNTNKKGKMMGDYDGRLLKSHMFWLTPKIHYTGLVEESKNIEVRIKVFMPNGLLWSNPVVSTTFSTSTLEIPINSGEGSVEINEWSGTGTSAIFPALKFPAGQYRMEVWHKDICLGAKTFDVF